MCHLIEKERQIALASGLCTIIDAAEAAGWSVKRGNSSVELVKPVSRPEAPIGYAINSKWWCKHLRHGTGKSFRVTAPDLLQLRGLPTQE
jgi:hypothetical protein